MTDRIRPEDLQPMVPLSERRSMAAMTPTDLAARMAASGPVEPIEDMRGGRSGHDAMRANLQYLRGMMNNTYPFLRDLDVRPGNWGIPAASMASQPAPAGSLAAQVGYNDIPNAPPVPWLDRISADAAYGDKVHGTLTDQIRRALGGGR